MWLVSFSMFLLWLIIVPHSLFFQSLSLSFSSFLVHPSCLCLLCLTNYTASICSAAHGRSIRNKNSLLKCQYFIFVQGQKNVQLLSTGLCCLIFHQLLWFMVFHWLLTFSMQVTDRQWQQSCREETLHVLLLLPHSTSLLLYLNVICISKTVYMQFERNQPDPVFFYR